MNHLDQLVEMAMGRPQRNLAGDLGPMCPVCSGLGKTLMLGGSSVGRPVTRGATQCTCGGSGIDLNLLERIDRELMWQQIHNLESKMGLQPTSRYRMPKIEASRQYWTECIYWTVLDGVTISNSTTRTIIYPNVTVPANYMSDGRNLKLLLKGKYSTLGSGTVTVVFDIRWGGQAGTVICTTGTITLLVSMVNALFEVEAVLQTRSNGSTGTILGNGKAICYGATAPTIGSATGAPAVAPMTAGGQTAPAAVTLALDADTALGVCATLGAASASDTLTGLHYELESAN